MVWRTQNKENFQFIFTFIPGTRSSSVSLLGHSLSILVLGDHGYRIENFIRMYCFLDEYIFCPYDLDLALLHVGACFDTFSSVLNRGLSRLS